MLYISLLRVSQFSGSFPVIICTDYCMIDQALVVTTNHSLHLLQSGFLTKGIIPQPESREDMASGKA